MWGWPENPKNGESVRQSHRNPERERLLWKALSAFINDIEDLIDGLGTSRVMSILSLILLIETAYCVLFFCPLSDERDFVILTYEPI